MTCGGMIFEVGEPDTDKLVWAHVFTERHGDHEAFPEETQAAIVADAAQWYEVYADACDAEECEPLSFDMWMIHGTPMGSI